jgi:hypothetical protein
VLLSPTGRESSYRPERARNENCKMRTTPWIPTWSTTVVRTNQARTYLTPLSRRESMMSCWYGRSQNRKWPASIQSKFPCQTAFSESLANYHQKRQSINTMTCNKLKQSSLFCNSSVCFLWFSSCFISHMFCPSDDAAWELSAFKNLEQPVQKQTPLFWSGSKALSKT